jgi:hypothetical protein
LGHGCELPEPSAIANLAAPVGIEDGAARLADYGMGDKLLGRLGQAARTIYRDWVGRMPLRPINRELATRIPGLCNQLDLLIATKRGLYRLVDGKLWHLLSGEFYGLSHFDGRWYAFERTGSCGRLASFMLIDCKLGDAQRLGERLSPGCHQIDFIGDRLFVTDTYNNRLLVFSIENGAMHECAAVFPPGPLAEGRRSENYAHMNSLWSDGERIYLLYHNETAKTQRHSEIVRLDENLAVVETFVTAGRSAHNVIRHAGDFLVCSSLDGSLLHGDREVYRGQRFTRGLCVTNEHIIIGGSDYGKRSDRNRLRGSVTVLDMEYHALAEFEVPGMVQEIRRTEGFDLGLSNSARRMDAATA